ncbi:uncharacterized protein LOC112343587 [Selaginella moellendorffii]|uniref:uncharacterized protein LOC112343587 n=1 Tax=Selaginella moellendorffii TaxID=88036 RepID=UPI000D1CD399|nr:uncharacterized protein LOC112343587 [Selaginella moellendorffii]|eukprot:XP_024523081.1 uncharacterized protein LOC112343587 [Selaginella moellendorffii]
MPSGSTPVIHIERIVGVGSIVGVAGNHCVPERHVWIGDAGEESLHSLELPGLGIDVEHHREGQLIWLCGRGLDHGKEDEQSFCLGTKGYGEDVSKEQEHSQQHQRVDTMRTKQTSQAETVILSQNLEWQFNDDVKSWTRTHGLCNFAERMEGYLMNQVSNEKAHLMALATGQIGLKDSEVAAALCLPDEGEPVSAPRTWALSHDIMKDPESYNSALSLQFSNVKDELYKIFKFLVLNLEFRKTATTVSRSVAFIYEDLQAGKKVDLAGYVIPKFRRELKKVAGELNVKKCVRTLVLPYVRAIITHRSQAMGIYSPPPLLPQHIATKSSKRHAEEHLVNTKRKKVQQKTVATPRRKTQGQGRRNVAPPQIDSDNSDVQTIQHTVPRQQPTRTSRSKTKRQQSSAPTQPSTRSLQPPSSLQPDLPPSPPQEPAQPLSPGTTIPVDDHILLMQDILENPETVTNPPSVEQGHNTFYEPPTEQTAEQHQPQQQQPPPLQPVKQHQHSLPQPAEQPSSPHQRAEEQPSLPQPTELQQPAESQQTFAPDTTTDNMQPPRSAMQRQFHHERVNNKRHHYNSEQQEHHHQDQQQPKVIRPMPTNFLEQYHNSNMAVYTRDGMESFFRNVFARPHEEKMASMAQELDQVKGILRTIQAHGLPTPNTCRESFELAQ